MRAAVRACAVAGLLLLASCAAPPISRQAATPDPETVRAHLLHDEANTRTVRGLARLAYTGPEAGISASQVVVVALPSRARLETLTPLGTTALVATLRDEELRVHSLLRHEYGVARATRETLGRLLRVDVPPELFLRLLAGLPPLRLNGGDRRLTVVGDGPSVRVESVDGEYRQRFWIEAEGGGAARGEVERGGDVLFRFTLADRQSAGARRFPFDLAIEDPSTGSALRLRYERVDVNVPVDADLFVLPAPSGPDTRIIDLEGGSTTPPTGIAP
jgi:hypothetical protein